MRVEASGKLRLDQSPCRIPSFRLRQSISTLALAALGRTSAPAGQNVACVLDAFHLHRHPGLPGQGQETIGLSERRVPSVQGSLPILQARSWYTRSEHSQGASCTHAPSLPKCGEEWKTAWEIDSSKTDLALFPCSSPLIPHLSGLSDLDADSTCHNLVPLCGASY